MLARLQRYLLLVPYPSLKLLTSKDIKELSKAHTLTHTVGGARMPWWGVLGPEMILKKSWRADVR